MHLITMYSYVSLFLSFLSLSLFLFTHLFVCLSIVFSHSLICPFNLIRKPVKQKSGHPKVVSDGNPFVWTDLVFPLKNIIFFLKLTKYNFFVWNDMVFWGSLTLSKNTFVRNQQLKYFDHLVKILWWRDILYIFC